MLSPYVDGQLTLPERQVVEDHMRSCDACGLELAQLQRLKTLLGQLPQRSLPRSFVIGPQRRRPAALSGSLGGFARALTSVAAALVMVAVGLSLAIQGLPRQSSLAAPAPVTAPASVAVGAKPAAVQAPAVAAKAPASAAGAAQARPAATGNVAATQAAEGTGGHAASRVSGQPAVAPPPSAGAPLNVPRLAGELLLALVALGVVVYSIRWWRS